MTREEAALIVKDHAWGQANMLRMVDGDDSRANVLNEAVEIVCNAIRGPEWVRTADRLPTIDDARYDGYVLVANKNRHYGVRYWSYLEDEIETCPYWMPLPKLPEVEG
jgi:hypothetical protein